MFSRVTRIPLFLAAAVAVPYLVTNGPQGVTDWWKSAQGKFASATAGVTAPDLAGRMTDAPPPGPGRDISPVSTPLEGSPSMALEEILRFDVTKEWVYQHWARKSTALSELGLYGVRVPLVTGTQLSDLAGSLTYFFDREGRVQRISFAGKTGDTTRVVMLAVQQFGLQPQLTPVAGEQLFQIKRGADVLSELSTQPASVLWSSSPHDSFTVEFDLQRPGSTSPLPPRIVPLPEVKQLEPAVTTAANVAENNDPAKTAEEDPAAPKSFHERFQDYFPRSRVPGEQVRNLEKRDRIW